MRTKASPPVTGSFDFSWNGQDINEILSNISDSNLGQFMQSFKNAGFLNVVRSKDCAGYKWNMKWNNGGFKPPITVTIILTIKIKIASFKNFYFV